MSEKLKNIAKEVIMAVLLAVYPVSYLYHANHDKLLLKQTFLPFLIIGLAAILLFLVLKSLVIFKINLRNLYLIVPLLCILLFTYGYIFNLLSQLPYLTGFIKNRYLLPLYLIVSVILVCVIHAIQNKTALRAILSFFCVLNLMPYCSILVEYVNSPGYKPSQQQQADPTKITPANDNDPDIYYIVLDMYPSNEVLKEYWGFDNFAFLNKLKVLGFQVFNESQSNYPITYLALNSVLNMQYIHKQNGVKLNGLTKAYLDQTLQQNKVSVYLKSRGYNYYVFEGGIFSEPIDKGSQDFFLKADSRSSTINYQTSPDNDFFLLFVNNSIIFPFADRIRFISSDIYRKRIYYTLDKLPILSKQADKKFVIAHIMCPHSPFIFGQNGEKVFVDEKSPRRKKAFLNQLKFINKKIEPVLNQIINYKNGREKVIILQGDHGSREFVANDNFYQSENWVKEYYGNLNSVYHSNAFVGENSVYVSPVNTFRYLFNQYFRANYSLLKTRTIYTDYNYPLFFSEIE